MAVHLRVNEVAQKKGISMSKLHRQADVSYKTIKRIYSNPFMLLSPSPLASSPKCLVFRRES